MTGEETFNLDAAPYNAPGRQDWRNHVDERFEQGSVKMKVMSDDLAKNTEAVGRMDASLKEMKIVQTAQVETNTRIESKMDANNAATDELLEIIRTAKGFFRVVGTIGRWFRKIVLWTLPVATAILAFWYTLIGHAPPK